MAIQLDERARLCFCFDGILWNIFNVEYIYDRVTIPCVEIDQSTIKRTKKITLLIYVLAVLLLLRLTYPCKMEKDNVSLFNYLRYESLFVAL